MSAIDLYARELPGFAERVQVTLSLLQQAASNHPGAVVQATSLGAEDMVVTDLILRHQLPIAIGTLDTGMLHPETLALIPRIEQHYRKKLEVYRPQAASLSQYLEMNGELAMYRSLELRKGCCQVRKLEPLGRMLFARTAWITGLRRGQSNARGEVAAVERDDAGRQKFNPLADWSWNDVWHYIASNAVPFNPLHDQFMPSIGCAPCTRAIAVGEDFRAGRWWWEDEAAKECGLHVAKTTATPLTASA